MKRPVLLLLLFSLHFSLFARDLAVVTGHVVDAEHAPLAYATVMLMHSADSSLAQGVLTDDNGFFELEQIPAGDYYVKVDYLGMAPFHSDDFSLSPGRTQELPEIVLQGMETELESVSITARKPVVTVRPDRIVFNVGTSVNAIGSNALELLRKAPGVTVDNQDRIMVQGRSGVQIYIDGKPSPLTGNDLTAMLRALPASQIASIEVITQPSARFEAAGNAGIINIVLQQGARMGRHAQLELGGGGQLHPRFTSGASGNYRNEKVNVYGSIGYNRGPQANFMDLQRTQNGMDYTQAMDILDDGQQTQGKVGVDVFLSEKSTLGFMGNGSFHTNAQTSHSFTEIQTTATAEALGSLDARSLNLSQRSNQAYNLNYRFEDKDRGTFWNLDADYARFDNATDASQTNFFQPTGQDAVSTLSIFSTSAPTTIDLSSFKFDHERELFGGMLATGGKFSYVRTRNDFQFYQHSEAGIALSAEHSNQFDYTENINALYSSWQGEFGDWSVTAGLRAEHTHSNGQLTSAQSSANDTVSRDYLDLFPSAGLTYALNETHQFRLNYSRRIDRPQYQHLNPFLNQLDELTYQQGNPFLQPQYTHSAELTYVLHEHITTSVKYSRTTDLMAELADTIGGNRGYLTHVNLQSQEVTGLYVSLPFSPTHWWETYTNIGVYHTRNQADFGEAGKEIDLSQVTWNLYHQNSFQLPADLALEVSGFYTSPSVWGANFQLHSFGGIDVGVQKRFLNEQASLKLSLNDVLYSMQWQGSQEYGGLSFQGSGGWESRQFKVNFSYLFGSESKERVNRRRSGLEDERGRALNG